MSYAFPIDPLEVLGVPADATLDQIQTAFRTKSKRYHPDAGGDAWAFRILVRSYEILSTARVLERARDELGRGPDSADPDASSFEVIRPLMPRTDEGEVRQGARDSHLTGDRLVGVEMLLLRFEVDSPFGLLVGATDQRNLSCTLNLLWPEPAFQTRADPASRDRILRDLVDLFNKLMRKSKAMSGWSRTQNGLFEAWLTYPTAVRADEAFRALRLSLQRLGLGVNQTIRDLTIPRTWKHG